MSVTRRAAANLLKLLQSAADPGGEVDRVVVYVKDVGGLPQLFAQLEDGTIYPLTSAAPKQVFRYTATGAEGASFTVALPTARANVNYAVFVSMGDAAAALAIRLPQTGRTVNDFPVEASSPPTLGDVFEFVVEDLT